MDGDDGNVLALEVTRADNPIYYQLMDEGESLMHELDLLMTELGTIRVPRFRFRPTRKRVRNISRKHDELSAGRFEGWELSVSNFLLAPQYGRIPTEHATLFFLHASQTLRDNLHRVEAQFRTLGTFIMALSFAISNQESRLYAVAALALTVIALYLSIIGLLLSIIGLLLSISVIA